jgi:hypothetical protein
MPASDAGEGPVKLCYKTRFYTRPYGERQDSERRRGAGETGKNQGEFPEIHRLRATAIRKFEV